MCHDMWFRHACLNEYSQRCPVGIYSMCVAEGSLLDIVSAICECNGYGLTIDVTITGLGHSLKGTD